MGIKQDIKESLKKFEITKIDGQPTNEVMNQLTSELGAMLNTVPTTNGGDNHRHIGMIFNDKEYITSSTSATPFTVPKNQGPCPTSVSSDKVDQLQQIAEHKQLIIKCETFQGCLQATRAKIIQALDPEWLAGLRSKLLGFTHCTPIKMLTHLCSNCATLNDVDVQELISIMDSTWNPTENTDTKFKRDDKIKQQIVKVGIPADPQHAVKHAGNFNPAIRK